jgi:hypothetical protein
MTVFSQDNRCGLDKIISTWDDIKLQRELAKSPRKRAVVKKAHYKQIEARRIYREKVREGERITFRNG